MDLSRISSSVVPSVNQDTSNVKQLECSVDSESVRICCDELNVYVMLGVNNAGIISLKFKLRSCELHRGSILRSLILHSVSSRSFGKGGQNGIL